MSNADSYAMMEAFRKMLSIKTYQADGKLEIVLQLTTVDGKVHQLCNSHVKVN